MVQNTMFIHFLITLMAIIIPKSSSMTPTYLKIVCSNTTLYSSKSRYQENVNTVFGYLSSNATNPSGYHAAVAGNGTNDVVYGHFLCRGDQSPSSCHDCVSTATTTDLPIKYCPNTKVANIWYDECMVRYSNESFFGVLAQNNENALQFNTQNITGNVSRFTDVMSTMMNGMVNRAVNGGLDKKYATGFATYTNLEGIYGLEQCTPDLSASDCNQCLLQAVQSLPLCKGAKTIWSSCNARFETYPFFNGADKLALSAQPLSPKSNSTGEGYSDVESLQYDLSTLQSATNNFSIGNKLGEGGFGSIYKGTLSNGEVVAVKRLAKSSAQGAQEFKTELTVVAKLQHRNLARLLGFCLDGNEKLLVYEYAPNKSLDNFIFDPIKKGQLNWAMRYNIIQGIARGILYLHQDSRLRVIHRDLKASNILLDANMNAKISDFGLARLFGADQTQSNTSRVVGTFGYMPPEYVMHGKFSSKSDVYSFGVLVLEIISGKKNNSFCEPGYAEDLTSYAWKVWQEGKPLMLVDEVVRDSCSNHEVMRCIHLGLLCVQEPVEARPTIDTIVLSLDSFTVTLPHPTQPAFFSKATGETSIAHRMDAIQ